MERRTFLRVAAAAVLAPYAVSLAKPHADYEKHLRELIEHYRKHREEMFDRLFDSMWSVPDNV